jgi:two-component system, sensor histidine kinase LadS
LQSGKQPTTSDVGEQGWCGGACRYGVVLWFLPLICIIWLVGLSSSSVGAPLKLDGERASVSVRGHLSAFHDISGQMDFAAIERAAVEGRFRPLEGAFNPGLDRAGVWWLRFALRASDTGDGEWWLAVDAHPLTDSVDALVPVRGADGRIVDAWLRSGTEVPVANRYMPVSLFVFRMDVPLDEEQVVYIRIAGTRSIRAQVDLWRLPDLVGYIVSVTTILSMLLGAAALLGVAAMIMGAWLRERTLVLLGINTSFMTALQILITGLALQLFAGFSHLIIYSVHALVLYLTAGSMALLIMDVFRGFADMPWIRRFMWTFLAFSTVGAALTPFGFYQPLLSILLVLSIIFSLLTILAAYRWMRAGEPSGLWYFIGLSLSGFVLMAYSGRVLGLLPLTSLSAWIFPALVLAQIVAIFVGVIVAIQAHQRTRQALEQDLLAASRRNEKMLEVAVEARTHALRQALREQRNLLSMVSHEFRTPLSTIGAAVDVIRHGTSTLAPMDTRELAKIGRATRRLGGLIDTFLAEEWLDRASLELRVRHVDLHALLTEIARDGGIESERDIQLNGPEQLRVAVDPLLLRVAVGNIVSNALKYSSGPVTLAFGATEEAVEIRVEDKGSGVDPAEQETIFERYYRSDTHASLPGAGLGLFIVARIASLHGGTVRVEDAVGGGSVFIMVLPAARESEVSA